jgi:hypothetical protein
MKTCTRSVPNPARSFVNPLDHAILPLFFVLAFLPAILKLASSDALVTNPLAVLGPAAAGFWFAASRRERQVNSALLGAAATTLLWSVNWLMLADANCCSL